MKPRVGVSACLLGHPVRYDGDARPHAWIRDILPEYADLLPFCPETQAGLTVPRPAVQLVRKMNGEIIMRGVADQDLDVTGRMRFWMEQQESFVENLHALIFKSRSPSCGLGSTPVYSEAGAEVEQNQDGLFAAWVRHRFPDLLLFDDVFLDKSDAQAVFLSLLADKSGIDRRGS
ncbi:DUF523 domain-containing protein [Thiolapillus sp.]